MSDLCRWGKKNKKSVRGDQGVEWRAGLTVTTFDTWVGRRDHISGANLTRIFIFDTENEALVPITKTKE